MSNYLPLAIRNILVKTGWTENEIVVYSSLIEKGAMNMTTISHETSIGIPTLQYTLKKLLTKKMIRKTLRNNRPHYMVADIEQLKSWTSDFLQQYHHFNDAVAHFIEQYDFNPQMFTARERFYEGKKGFKQSYRDMLDACEEGDEIVAFFSVIEDVGVDLQEFFLEEYVPKRVKKKIHMRNIASTSPKAIHYLNNDARDLRQTKLIPRGYFPPLNTEINLFGDSMHFMSFDERGAYAFIIQDAQMVTILRAVFNLLWNYRETLYMTDEFADLGDTISSRAHLYPPNLKEKWKTAKPSVIRTPEGERVMKILGHEVMSDYQEPYMQALAEIVTRNGGDILNVGYGLGILGGLIESHRESRQIDNHFVIEMNHQLAEEARKVKNLQVIEGDWHDVIKDYRGVQFDGIVYDGYPLDLEEVHRDGIVFIRRIVERNLLKKDGILTFYVDAVHDLGKGFRAYLEDLGFNFVEIRKIPVDVPKRERQVWRQDHFLAPILKYD